jgi:hypothetical protein
MMAMPGGMACHTQHLTTAHMAEPCQRPSWPPGLLAGAEPSYVAASGSATAYTLWLAISRAFEACAINMTVATDADALLFNPAALQCYDPVYGTLAPNITGYEMVRASLAQLQVDTFFGRVAFNKYQRNIAKPIIITQILGGRIEAVLPLDEATTQPVIPVVSRWLTSCVASCIYLRWDCSWQSDQTGTLCQKSAAAPLHIVSTVWVLLIAVQPPVPSKERSWAGLHRADIVAVVLCSVVGRGSGCAVQSSGLPCCRISAGD